MTARHILQRTTGGWRAAYEGQRPFAWTGWGRSADDAIRDLEWGTTRGAEIVAERERLAGIIGSISDTFAAFDAAADHAQQGIARR